MQTTAQHTVSSYYSAQQASGKNSVIAAIRTASQKSGVDFSYLLNQAAQESSLDPTAKATSSSATGLYQFIDQTWLSTMKQNGDKYGLGEFADKITVGSDGVARVANSADKKAILALRNDPVIASEMAAELTKSNQRTLEAKVEGTVGSTELYLAHFLGAKGAANFIKTMQDNPNTSAASVLPSAASANKNVFYDTKTGRAKSVGEIYAYFSKKFDDAPVTSGQTSQFASVSGGSSVARNVADAKSVEYTASASMLTASLSSSETGDSFYQVSSGTKVDHHMSTPFAAMMIAQMDMESFGLEAKASAYQTERTSSDDENRKRSALSLLSHAA